MVWPHYCIPHTYHPPFQSTWSCLPIGMNYAQDVIDRASHEVFARDDPLQRLEGWVRIPISLDTEGVVSCETPLLVGAFWVKLPPSPKGGIEIACIGFCSSGACERNWSSFSLIHTKICYKLSSRQLERLVYCRSNMCMLRAMQKMEEARQVRLAQLQVNVAEFKLAGNTLKSVNKEVDEDEERLYAELYRELEEMDRHISRTRCGVSARVRTREFQWAPIPWC